MRREFVIGESSTWSWVNERESGVGWGFNFFWHRCGFLLHESRDWGRYGVNESRVGTGKYSTPPGVGGPQRHDVFALIAEVISD
jgi:hypothetical protein